MAETWQDIKRESNSEEVPIVDIGDNNDMEDYEIKGCIIFGKHSKDNFQVSMLHLHIFGSSRFI